MACYVYALSHQYKLQRSGWEYIFERKQIGYYSTYKKAYDIMLSYRCLIGFSDYPTGFKIKKIRVGGVVGKKTISKVYRLTHEYYNSDQNCDIVTNFGLFFSFEKANVVLNRLKTHKRFSTYPDGFCIDEWKVDDSKDWSEGFVPFD